MIDPVSILGSKDAGFRVLGDIFDESVLCGLDAFVGVILRLVADGTSFGWEHDEGHFRGGYEVVQLNEQAKALERPEGASHASGGDRRGSRRRHGHYRGF